MLDVFVPGTPKSKGSLVTGTRKDGGRFNRTQNAHGQASWAAAVKYEVRQVMLGLGLDPVDCAIHLELTFQRPRPASHYGGGKHRARLKPDMERALPKGRPDADKLMRSVADALQGVLYVDDAQITTAIVTKRWGPAGVRIVAQPDMAPGDLRQPRLPIVEDDFAS